MVDNDVVRLETARLVLRPLREGDEDGIVSYASDPDVFKWTIAIPRPYTAKDALDFIKLAREHWEKGTGLSLGIELKEGARLIGGVGFARIDGKNKSAELGYVLHPEFRRRGITTEACMALLKHGFIEMGLERVHVKHFEGNDASRALIQRLGFKFEGIARHEVLKDGVFVDTHNYSMLKDEWDGEP